MAFAPPTATWLNNDESSETFWREFFILLPANSMTVLIWKEVGMKGGGIGGVSGVTLGHGGAVEGENVGVGSGMESSSGGLEGASGALGGAKGRL